MTLTAVRLLSWTTRKFFLNSTYIISRKKESNFLGPGSQNELTANSSLESARRKFFMKETYIMSRK